jgi:NADH-quinone oxidoreductase subunit N
MNVPDFNLGGAAPALLLAIGACVLLVADLFFKRREQTAWSAIVLLGIAFVLSLGGIGQTQTAFGGMYIADSFTALINITAIVTAFLSIIGAFDYMNRTNMQRGEFYPLLLMTTAGAMFMGASGDLLVVFVALELLSIPLYIMAGMRRNDARSEESAMKYFLLGSFATGFLVYGIALMYGATGTTNLGAILEAVSQAELSSAIMLLLGAGLVLVGLGFKVAAVPFHIWTPDVYQGAPTPVTAYMSVAAKVGGFAALLRVLAIAMPIFTLNGVQVIPNETVLGNAVWQDTVSVMAALTMILGNFVAITQKDIKRLLAYSSIAHAGYILMAVAAVGTFQVAFDAAGNPTYSLSIGQEAIQGAIIYLLAYAFTNIGAFAVVIAMERNDGTGTAISDLAGLGRMRPPLAIAMTIYMLSLTGIPLTGGFVGKFFVFQSALNANLGALALIGVLTSVVSAYYYLRVIVTIWLEAGEADVADYKFPLSSTIALTAVGTVLLGILPLAVNLAGTVTNFAQVALR